jgi:hypothetical protein
MSSMPVTIRSPRPTAPNVGARSAALPGDGPAHQGRQGGRGRPGDGHAGNGGRLLVGGALAVIYDADANEVITVLWAQRESRAGGPVRRTAVVDAPMSTDQATRGQKILSVGLTRDL